MGRYIFCDKLPDVWRARWIDPELVRPWLEVQPISGHENDRNPAARQRKIEHRVGASYLRKRFRCKKTGQANILLYATAHGIYDIWINGCHLDGCLLAPKTSQYNKRLMVQCYQVGGLLRDGPNEILISLGDGWYRGCVGNSQDINTFGDDLAFLCQMEADGVPLLWTGSDWEAAQDSPLGLNDMMRGEVYDGRRTEDDMHWHGVTVRDFGYSTLIPDDGVPVTAHERFPAELIHTPSGELVLDFGQNFAGYVEMVIPDAREGGRIILTHGETLDENGNFTTANFQNPAKPECHQRIEYICREGENRYHPTKCYFGFRYVKVEADFPVAAEMFTGMAIYSDMRETCQFSCGDERVNRLFQNAMWSMKSNFVGVPTDCPTREKSGFSGDAQIFCDTALYLMDSVQVLRTYLRELDTSTEPGVFRQVAPDRRAPGYFENSHGWCDAIELITWRVWKRTGDDSIIRENYVAMKRWLDFSIERARGTRPENLDRLSPELLPYFADAGFCWGEWLEPGGDQARETMEHMRHGEPEVATAYLSYGCRALAEMADAVGETADSVYYAVVAEKAREAYRAAFLPIDSERQCRYVRPIFMDLLDAEEKTQVAEALAKRIRANGNHLNTGFLSTAELCRALSENGQTETAYDLLLQPDCPGWLYPISKGATTIWERWEGIGNDGKPKDSLNHYAYGSVAAWLIDSVCGIRVRNGKIVIAPHPDPRLGHAEAAYDSPLGIINSSWRYQGEKLLLEVTVPEGRCADLILPTGEKVLLSAGKHTTIL